MSGLAAMDIRRFLAELKGRGIYRVAAFYAAGSWAFLQVADIFFPILGFPDWAITTVLVAAALGFPVAIALSWLFEITPAGIVETDTRAVDFGRLRLSPARLVELGLLTILVCLVGFLYLDRLAPWLPGVTPGSGTPAVAGGGRPSVAVMAFQNMSDDPSVDYFGDGLAEEILNLLASLSELNVAARTSSFYFKGKNVDLREVGRKLGVNHILEGSVRRAGDEVRVTAQLVEMETGFRVWSGTYDRSYSDSFLIQDEIARQVVGNMQVILSDNSRQLLDERPTLVPEAYDFYLRGREYLRDSLSKDGLSSAQALFERAIELDSSYAAAYAGLCESQLGLYRIELDGNRFDAAQDACQQALASDGHALTVHVALGNLYRYSGRYDDALIHFDNALLSNPESVDALDGLANTYRLDNKSQLAEETFLRAIRLQPNYWRGYMSMGGFLFVSGRFEEAIPYYRRITELMPDNAQAFNDLGAAYYLLGDFDQSSKALQQSLSLEPTALAYSNAGSSLFFLGRYREAVDMYQKAVEYAPEDFQNWGALGDAYQHADDLGELARPMYSNAIELASERLRVNPQDSTTLSLLAHYHARVGNREEAVQYIAQARALAPKDMYVHYNIALALTTLGEVERAIAALQRTVELGYSPELIALDAGFTSLRASPGFDLGLAESD
jgi:TolB-like protein/Flp pilus assembly protein TadD